MDIDVTTRVLEALERRGVRYAVFGAVALNILGFVRATEDLDLFIAPERENIEALKRALDDVFHDPQIEQISAVDLLGDYPAVQYVPPSGDFHLDILTRLGDAWRFSDLEIERAEFSGGEVSVVSPEGPVRCRNPARTVPSGGSLMPVRRYRSFEEIPAPPLHARGSTALFRAIAATWSAAHRLAPLRFPPGVFRHRSLGDLNAQTDAWSHENIRELARRRRPVGT